MESITYPDIRRYPHELKTRVNAVTNYRTGQSVRFICRLYKISKASLMRWNERYDGIADSLKDKSNKSHTVNTQTNTPQ